MTGAYTRAMAIEMTGTWLPFDRMGLARQPARPGVYELATADGEVLLIGFAGTKGRSGLRGELEKHLKAPGDATRYRAEATSRYLQRYEEVLAAYASKHGTLPPWNVAKAKRAT